jgi:hypothetical protein
MEITLPKKVKVGDKWYSVEVVEAMKDKDDMGRVHYPEQKIKIGLRNNRTGRKFSSESVKETFWHELVHAILEDMGEQRLNNREDFVEGFAARLATAIETARF